MHGFKGTARWVVGAIVLCPVIFLIQRIYQYDGETGSFKTTVRRKDLARNIFFLETSGLGNLTGRMSCAVESAALLHPNWTVTLLTVQNLQQQRSPSPFFDLLKGLPNVIVSTVKPFEVLRGTPLSSWNLSGTLQSSPFRVAHLADVLRLAVLYKHGGVYLDLDVVVLRSLEDLENCVSQTPTQEQDMTANGFLIFDRHHPFLEDCMNRVRRRYRPTEWGSIGPHLVKEAILSRCRADSVQEAVVSGSCRGVRVLPFDRFLPIYFKEWGAFFDPNKSTQVWRASRHSYVMHVYNALSSKTPALPGCAYAQAAQKFCPLSWNRSVTMQRYF